MPPLRPVHYKLLVALFEREGYTFDRQRGDHLIYVKTGVARPIVIPAYSEVPVFIIKNLIRTANIDRERYFELLERL
ncbi:MAG TPA: type II toxin-antitoxin system HicA family toxin [Terracidiphilus sp.]|jgi:predicted RNA binding protein YcfA (HicA-like mRNA interferase family)